MNTLLDQTHITESAKHKLRLYTIADFLFNSGKSHPQVIKLMKDFEPDHLVLTSIVDKAMGNEWDKLFEEARLLYASGLTHNQVLQSILQKETDVEIANWICGEWYTWKTFYAECLIEGPTNRTEGMRWIFISVTGVIIAFWIDLSWLSKIIWITSFVISFIQWLVGMRQKAIANKITHLFTVDDPVFDDNREVKRPL